MGLTDNWEPVSFTKLTNLHASLGISGRVSGEITLCMRMNVAK